MSLLTSGSSQNFVGISFAKKIDPDTVLTSLVEQPEAYNRAKSMENGNTDSIEKRLLALKNVGMTDGKLNENEEDGFKELKEEDSEVVRIQRSESDKKEKEAIASG